MRLVKIILVALTALVSCAGSASAQDDGFQADTMIQGGDYETFKIKGARPARACSEACRRDPRCQAWTFIRAVGQCRLKRSEGQAIANACCVSGYKQAEAASGGSKQEFCSEYARTAAEANEENLQQGCRLKGERWASNFKSHFAWCIRSPRSAAESEAAQRSADLDACRQEASGGSKGICDHYVRLSMVQIETSEKARCGFPQGDGTWVTDPRFHQRKCDAAPNAVPRQMIRRREVLLDRCFENAGRNETECTDYAAEAVSMFQKGMDNRCEVEESRRWNASRSRHYAWCLDASAAERKSEAAARKGEVEGCIKRAALRKTCQGYAEAAVSQALRNERQRCGFRGVSWSKYNDDHFDFCMQADDADREDEAANRDRDLKKCEQKDVVDEECDTYAKRAVRLNDLAEDKDCRLTSVDLWSSSYRQHYRFCVESNYEERQAQQQQRRRQLRQCAFQRGFTISLDIDF